MKRRCGIVVGMPDYAKYLARLVNENSVKWRLRAVEDGTRIGTIRATLKARRSDAIICFGGPAPNVALLEVARECGIPVIVIWAGGDVIGAVENPLLLQTVRLEELTHVSDSPWLVDELRLLGIEARHVPVTAVSEGPPVRALPQEFRVLTYVRDAQRDVQGRAQIYEIARALPEIPFVLAGRGAHDTEAPSNVQFVGPVADITPYIDNATVLLRVPQHDGKSMFVLEALARGRHVVWNQPFPHCNRANDVGEIIATLTDLQQRHRRAGLALNHDGRRYALEHFRRDAIAEGFEKILDSAIARSRPMQQAHALRVAVSGLPLFCAQVAQAARLHAPHCDVRIMHSDTRLQVLTAIHTLIRSDIWYSIGAPRQDRLLRVVANIFRKPQVMHWVGTDILHLNDRRLRNRLQGDQYVHLAEVGWTQRELLSCGIEAGIVPLPIRYGTVDRPAPLPEKFTLLLYIPRHRSECYGLSEYSSLMRDLAGEPVRYLVVGGGEISAPAGVDIENLGWRQDLRSAYEQSTALIRFTAHDGLSLMAVEALSFARYLIWTQPFPNALQVSSYPELLRTVRELLERHKNGGLQLNAAGREYVTGEYDAASCTQKLVDIWRNVNRDAAADVSDAALTAVR